MTVAQTTEVHLLTEKELTELMNALERETVVNTSDGDEVVRIWTAQRFAEIRTGFVDGSEWAEFEVDSDSWNPASGVKRNVNLSEKQRSEAAERLRRARGGT